MFIAALFTAASTWHTCVHAQSLSRVWLLLIQPHRLRHSRLSVHGVLQARILKCLAMSYSRGLFNPGSETAPSTSLVLQMNSLRWATREGPITQVCPSAKELIKKMGYIHSGLYISMYTTCIILYTYIGILCSHKKNEILPFVTTWVGLENIMLSEISQMGKNKYCLISLTCEI